MGLGVSSKCWGRGSEARVPDAVWAAWGSVTAGFSLSLSCPQASAYQALTNGAPLRRRLSQSGNRGEESLEMTRAPGATDAAGSSVRPCAAA